ncbi:hypothetical protein ILUMI_05531 [Ignelater luminosus]|uniref:Ion transport domain-containing protein n=1 Tax=Ignelater luminosus TaxID=2038154 RepID=A0A8K0DCT1_IGNLU|nr:hypothetical protein ILUMI_05531 [Ignelater luminosus]
MITVYVSPIDVFEKLFFAVFGMTGTQHLQTTKHEQSLWTTTLFKVVFGVYMLVSVVVLINLLIAMMTDTYQRIQAQSDIEWKFGLCKLIRNMHRTSTAPSPINLFSTWLFYFIDLCKQVRRKKRKGPSVTQVINTFKGAAQGKPMSPRSKAAYKWLSMIRNKEELVIQKDPTSSLSVTLNSPVGSHMALEMQANRIEHVSDWELVAKKYRDLTRYTEDQKETEDTDDL